MIRINKQTKEINFRKNSEISIFIDENKDLCDKLMEINKIKDRNKKNFLSKEFFKENKEIITNKMFINFYYWFTDLLLDNYKNILKFKTASHFKDSFVDDILTITFNCKDCGKLISHIEKPTSRTDKKHILNSYKHYKCPECKEKYENEEKIRRELREKEILLKEQAEQQELELLKTMPYKDYLQTDHWKKTRKKALYKADYKCQLCNSKEKLNVHHKTYENRGCEKSEDLIVLCEECHGKFHGKIKVDNQSFTDENFNNKLVKTKLFLVNINENDSNIDKQINEFTNKNNITNIIDIKTNLNDNNIYSALIIYN